MKKLVVLLCVLNFCFALSLSLDQPSLHLETERGARTKHRLKLTNRGDTDLRLKVYAMDWRYMEDGAKEFLAPDTRPYSCADWLVLPQDRVQIPARSTLEYRFELKTPPNAAGGHQAVLFFETETADASGGLNYGLRLGSLIYQKTRKYTLDAIEPVLLKTRLQDGVYTYELFFENKGNAWNSVQGSVTLLEDGAVLEQQELGVKGLLPGDTAMYAGSFEQGATADRVEVLYLLEDATGALQTGQLLSADSAESIAQTKLWVERFEPVYNPAHGALEILCELEASNVLRVNPVVKIYNVATKRLVKTVEFNPKVLRPNKAETLTISWPTGSAVIGALPPGEYNCVLNIKNGRDTVTEQKIVRID
ncbi:MAG: hypothetical protein LBQ83_04785 [Candidatus Margulisbacteria bacterium]|nr:hypothetical protein [Candidatus Margulisiibacteriota bacterium]